MHKIFTAVLLVLVSMVALADQIQSKFIASSAISQSKLSHPHYSARVTCGSSGSAVVTQYPSWISSVSNGSTGACTVNITGSIFAAAPNCSTAIFNATGGSNWQFVQVTASSTSAISLFRAFNATAANGDVMIVCQASR